VIGIDECVLQNWKIITGESATVAAEHKRNDGEVAIYLLCSIKNK